MTGHSVTLTESSLLTGDNTPCRNMNMDVRRNKTYNLLYFFLELLIVLT